MEEAVAPRPLRIGWNVPGTFSRLGIHVGMLIAWMNAGLPLPSLVVATSAGAIFSACCISFDRAVIRRVARTIRYLKREQIYVLSRGLIKTGIYLLAAGGTLIITATSVGSLGWQWAPLLLPLAFLAGVARFRPVRIQFVTVVMFLVTATALAAWYSNGWPSAIVFCTGLACVDWLVRKAVQIFFKETGSPFDTRPLRDLLINEDVARTAFLAGAELRVIATDVAVPEVIVYSNHEPLMCDPENEAHRLQFIDGIRGSAALPGRFPLNPVRGKVPRDGEVWTDYPIHQFSKEKNDGKQFDIVFRFDYWPPLMPGQAPRNLLEDLFASFDRMRDKNTVEKMARYELERKADSSLPRVINIRASAFLLAKIPDLAVYSFQPGQLWRSMKLGRLILRENLPTIRRELDLSKPEEAVS